MHPLSGLTADADGGAADREQGPLAIVRRPLRSTAIERLGMKVPGKEARPLAMDAAASDAQQQEILVQICRGRYVPLPTNGDGACALHAAFADEVRAGELFCQDARGRALRDLEATLEVNTTAASVRAELLEFIWAELAVPGARHSTGHHVAGLDAQHYWRQASRELREQIVAALAADAGEREVVDAFRGELRNRARCACQHLSAPALEELTRALAEKDPDHYGEFYDSPYMWHGSRGVLIVRGSDGCLAEQVGHYVTKLQAMLDPHPCYDGLRLSYFLPRLSLAQEVCATIYALGESRASLLPLHSVAQTLGHLQQAINQHVQWPACFATLGLEAYKCTIADERLRYNFSATELLLLARINKQNLIIVEHFGQSTPYRVNSYYLQGAGPATIVGLHSHRTAGQEVRTHFFRLAAQSDGRDSGSARAEAAAACGDIAGTSTPVQSKDPAEQPPQQASSSGPPCSRAVEGETNRGDSGSSSAVAAAVAEVNADSAASHQGKELPEAPPEIAPHEDFHAASLRKRTETMWLT